MEGRETVQRSVTLPAPPTRVWQTLTRPEQMAHWMAIFPMTITVSWESGASIHMVGDLHGLPFENHGTVLDVVPHTLLRYTHWSSLSGRPYAPGDVPVVQFTLTPDMDSTVLELTHSNVPSGPEHQHLPFYWNAALLRLGDLLANRDGPWDQWRG